MSDAADDDAGMTPAEMRAHLMAPDDPSRDWPVDPPVEFYGTEVSTNCYEEAARRAGRAILVFLEAHPEVEGDPYKAMKAAGAYPSDLGLTGFQWGWAMNAAQYVLDRPLVPNPAILTLTAVPDGSEDGV